MRYDSRASPADDFVGLFVEPTLLPVSRVLEVCQAVGRGHAHIRLGLFRGRLACTEGYVQLSDRRFRMTGVGGRLWVYQALSPLGLAEVRRAEYEPWF